MSLFAVNVLLAIVWAGLWANFSFLSVGFGFLIGYAALWAVQPLFDTKPTYFRRIRQSVGLFLYFLKELALSTVQVAWDVVTPTDLSHPAILEVPLDVKSDIEILLVTNLITLTPGTLSLDVTPDRKTLIIHAMFADDPEAIVNGIKSGLERRVKELFA